MKLDLQYRENEYYNTTDTYLCYDHSIKRYLLTKLENKGGIWYCVEKLKYKASSIKMINFNEIYHKEISLKDIDYKGVITKALEPDNFGIIWNSGNSVKKNGLSNFWTEWWKLEMDL